MVLSCHSARGSNAIVLLELGIVVITNTCDLSDGPVHGKVKVKFHRSSKIEKHESVNCLYH
jgi:hypothetical protein